MFKFWTEYLREKQNREQFFFKSYNASFLLILFFIIQIDPCELEIRVAAKLYFVSLVDCNVILNISSPPGYEPTNLSESGCTKFFPTPDAAVRNADLVTTDVWASMGFEEETKLRKLAFQKWQVNKALMAQAAKNAIFMHCLPAHREEEVTSEVIDGDQSVVWDEAENRLHVQKALMETLLLGPSKS